MTKKQKTNFVNYLEKSDKKSKRLKDVIKALKQKNWK